MKTLKSIISSLQHAPLKSFLTLFTVGLGVGVLVFALSISQTFSGKIKEELQQDGLILNIANAEYSDEDGMEMVRPPQFDENLITVLKNEISGLQHVAPISNPFWNEFVVAQQTYRIRTVVATTEEYAGLTSMQLVAGSFFTAEDVAKGNKNVILSESLAEMLFGSPEAAIGKTITPPMPDIPNFNNNSNNQANNNRGQGNAGSNQGNNNNQRRTQGMGMRFSLPTFTITGVFRDFSELKRKAFDLGDMVLPNTSIFPSDENVQIMQRFMLSSVMVSVKGKNLSEVEAQVRQVLAREYGDDVKVHIWEGTPRGQTSILEETRNTISTFALVVNLLGFLLLITGSIGILSIMLVEVLGKSRDIALERSLGASKIIIVKEYFIRSVLMTLLSVILGILLSLIFAQPLKEIVMPIFSNLGNSITSGSVITPLAMLTGAASAMLIGGVFGVLPLLTALRTVISEGLREG